MYIVQTTPIGNLLLEASLSGLRRCSWINPKFKLTAGSENQSEREILEIACRQIDEYFSGTRRRFELPLVISGTEFQQRVWRQMSEIPFGETISYSRLAELCDCKGGQRAVAGACGRNPLALILPCHRVTASGGALGGYSANSTIAPPPDNPQEIKRKLIEHERRG